jgi:hypothetical protein
MESNDPKPDPPDADRRRKDESARLIAQLDSLIKRASAIVRRHQQAAAPSATLADVLYADKSNHAPSERDWVALVEAVASREQPALLALHERAYRPVCASVSAIIGNREIPQGLALELAEELVLDVFHDVWHDASVYDPSDGPVLAWIMNGARLLVTRRVALFSRREHGVVQDYDAIAIDERARTRLADRIASENRGSAKPSATWREPEWAQVAPGISCKVLAADTDKHIVSMIVRLVPGGEYPAHVHAGREELHLLQGELWIDDQKLFPGDYNRAEPGTRDNRVWSETGCTCVLTTSTRDLLSG